MNRVFLGWTKPALPLAARHLVAHYAKGGVASMQGALLVLPGGRAMRRLKELLAEEAGTSGVRLVPPRLVTVGHLPEWLYTSPRPEAPAGAARLAWIAALREMPDDEFDRVFARRPEAGALTEWSALAGELMRLHRDAATAGLPFRDVANNCARAGSGEWDDAPRWRALAKAQEGYALRLGNSGMADRDLARMAALTEDRVQIDLDLWLVGVAELPIIMRQFLERVIAQVTALVHAPEQESHLFDAAGCVVPEAWQSAHIPLDTARILMADKPADQAEEVARAVAATDGSRAADDIVVGVPSAEVVPWIEERLSAAGVHVRDAAGVELRRTAPFRLLGAVADALESDRWEAYAALARHPDVGDWLARSGAADGRPMDELLAAADRWYGRHLPERIPGGSRIPGAHRADGLAVAALTEALREGLLEPLSTASRQPLSARVEPLLALLQTIYAGRELRHGRPSDQLVIPALEALGKVIGALRTLPRDLDEVCSAPAALRFALEQASSETIPNPQDRAAVELLGWLELHLDDAPVTVTTGVNEPNLPESVSAHAFLPDGLRSRLGLADNRLRYARDAYRLTAIAHSREHLTLVTGKRDAKGDPLRPSRLLFAADGETVAHRVRLFYDESYRADQDLREAAPHEEQQAEPPPSGFHLPPEPLFLLAESPRVLRVTDFRNILSDPYGYVLSAYRGCEPIDDHARELGGAQFGTLAHDVLERFGRNSEAAKMTDRDDAFALLSDLLDGRVNEVFGRGARDARVAVRLQVEQLRTRLGLFATWHADRIAQGWRILGVEVSTPKDGIPLDVDGEPVGIRGKIDRVEYHEERGEWALLDYKTGDTAKAPEKEHGPDDDGMWKDLQLPLYRWLLPRLVTDDGEPRFAVEAHHPIRLGYLPLSRDDAEVKEALAEWTDDQFEGALESARNVVRWLRSGEVRFDAIAVPKYADPRLKALFGLGQLGAEEEVEA